MKEDEIYRERKAFFNHRAEHCLDRWYRDEITGRYDKHAQDFKRLFALLPLKPGDHVLDVGCGAGILVPLIRESITATGLLYELDYAERMLALNRSHHEQEGVRFILADAEKAPLEDGSCDAVICFSCFPHFHDKAKALATLARILKPHGWLVIAHFASAERVNRHHRTYCAVRQDFLPERTAMYALLQQAGLQITTFIEEADLYCLIAAKANAR